MGEENGNGVGRERRYLVRIGGQPCEVTLAELLDIQRTLRQARSEEIGASTKWYLAEPRPEWCRHCWFAKAQHGVLTGACSEYVAL